MFSIVRRSNALSTIRCPATRALDYRVNFIDDYRVNFIDDPIRFELLINCYVMLRDNISYEEFTRRGEVGLCEGSGEVRRDNPLSL